MKKLGIIFATILTFLLNSCSSDKEYVVLLTRMDNPTAFGNSNEIDSSIIMAANDSIAYQKGYKDFVVALKVYHDMKSKYIKAPISFQVLNSERKNIKLNLNELTITSIEDIINKSVKSLEDEILNTEINSTNAFQEYFIKRKTELYNSGYLNANNSAVKRLFKTNTEKLTKQLLDSVNYTLTNWVGTISRVSLAYGHNQRDMELLKTMSPNAVIEKYPEGRDINIYITVGEKEMDKATYLAEVYQEFNPKKNERGIKPNSSLYETVLGLKEGQQVIFSARVKRTMDTNGKNYEQFTGFNIELTKIKPKK